MKGPAMTPQRVTLITLGPADLARARRLDGALGRRPAASAPRAAICQPHGAARAIYDPAARSAKMARAPVSLGTGAPTLAQNFPNMRVIDAAFAAAPPRRRDGAGIQASGPIRTAMLERTP
jgi:hypothetical protein